jgi:hypothetical protein
MTDSGNKNFTYCSFDYDSDSLKASSHNNNFNQSVKRDEIENVNSFYNIYLNKLPLQYCFRMLAIGLLGFIALGFLGFKDFGLWKILIWVSWGFFVGGVLLLLIDIFIDSLFGFRIAYRFFATFLGYKGYDIVVKNKSGNNVLEIFAEESEKSQISNFIISLKKDSIIEAKKIIQNQNGNDKLNQIEKLAELHQQGLLTHDEFQKMKRQLLGI